MVIHRNQKTCRKTVCVTKSPDLIMMTSSLIADFVKSVMLHIALSELGESSPSDRVKMIFQYQLI